jgi:hypothetical protein
VGGELASVTPLRGTRKSVFALLAARHAAPEWAFLQEVRSNVGTGPVRSADAIAMSLWPSRGLELHGFEVKVSRSDWLREKKDPAKAEKIGRYCHRWWLVVDDPEIVRLEDGELPPTWGLYARRGSRLTVEVPAPTREPEPIPYTFLAAILRSVTEGYVARAGIAGEIETKLREQRERMEESHRVVEQRLDEHIKKLEDGLKAFSEASGIPLQRYDLVYRGDRAQNLGEAVRFVLNGGLAGQVKELEQLAHKARYIADLAAEAATEAKKTEGAAP